MSTAMKNTPKDPRATQLENLVERENPYWSIMDSRGWNFIKFKFLSPETMRSFSVFEMHIHGKFWERDRPPLESQAVDDFNIILPQVLIDISALKLLCEKLKFWQISMKEFSVEIASQEEKGQSLIFSIGQYDELICSISKPACVISYSSGSAMQARWAFVVDQSCIRICAEEISTTLNQIPKVQGEDDDYSKSILTKNHNRQP